MLMHLSAKFNRPAKVEKHEKRAALFLNRYTRSLTIMYATNGLADVLGISGEELRGQSFYYCIQENCLQDAIRCLENAKANDSIAYLRFWFRDPREDEQNEQWPAERQTDSDEMDDVRSSDGDVSMGGLRRVKEEALDGPSLSTSGTDDGLDLAPGRYAQLPQHDSVESGTSSGSSGHRFSNEAVWGESYQRQSSTSSYSNSPDADRRNIGQSPLNSPRGQRRERIELEAVISCTSDGLVACLRRAQPALTHPGMPNSPTLYANGLYAVPWATEPMLPTQQQQSQQPQVTSFSPSLDAATAHAQARVQPVSKPNDDFMNSIREIAVFAWALTGINGGLAGYGSGTPRGEAQPPSGLPIWTSDGGVPAGSGRDHAMTNGLGDGMSGGASEYDMRPNILPSPFGNQAITTGRNGYLPQRDPFGYPNSRSMESYQNGKSVYR